MIRRTLANVVLFLFAFLYAAWVCNLLRLIPPWLFNTSKIPPWLMWPLV
jgi:hypothetical protein